MNESSKRIQEPTEAMRAEKDIRIRNMMMAVLGVLEDTLQVPPLILQTWIGARRSCGLPGSARAASVASETLPGGAEFRAQGTGGSRDWPTDLQSRTY